MKTEFPESTNNSFASKLRVTIVRYRYLLIALAVLLAILLVLARGARPLESAVVTVTKADVMPSVVASGRVMAPARVDLASTITGRVAKVAVREGNRVAADQLLIALQSEELDAGLQQARAQSAQAFQKLRSIRSVSQPVQRSNQLQAEANLDAAHRNAVRAAELVKKGFYSVSAGEDAEKQLQLARYQLESARAQAAAQENDGTDETSARLRYQETEAAVRVASNRLDQTQLRAPAGGVVLTRTVEPGDLAQPNRTLMTIALDGPVRITAQIDEKNLPLIVLGASVTVVADAYPNRRLKGKLSYIAPGVDASKGTVEVRVDIAEVPDFLRTDMTVTIEIDGPLMKDAILLPQNAVRDSSSATPFVWVLREGVAAKVPVSLGLQTQGKTVIEKGIAAGDTVLLNPALTEGMRVRAKQDGK